MAFVQYVFHLTSLHPTLLLASHVILEIVWPALKRMFVKPVQVDTHLTHLEAAVTHVMLIIVLSVMEQLNVLSADQDLFSTQRLYAFLVELQTVARA
jgi:hypothetical protein